MLAGGTLDHATICANIIRGRKFGFYRECPTIQEYLLIDSQRPMLEVYRRERHDLWILRAYRLDEDVELTNLGVRFPVSAVYEDVTW
jgi:Uma2 family endonuclease